MSNASILELENTLIARNSPGTNYNIINHTGNAGEICFLYCTVAQNGGGLINLDHGPIIMENSAFTDCSGCIIDASNVPRTSIASMRNNFLCTNNYQASDDVAIIGGDPPFTYAELNTLGANFSSNLGGANPRYVNPSYNDFTPSDSPLSPLIDSGNMNLDSGINNDLNNNPRPRNINTKQSDIGCIENQNGADPVVSGRVYDSVTNATVSNAVVAIYKNGESSYTDIATSSDGTYSFDVMPGNYFLVVSMSDYFFPSSRKSGLTSGTMAKYLPL